MFKALGFRTDDETGDYNGFENDGCRFILQNFGDVGFAQNFMLSVKISNAEEFGKDVLDKSWQKSLVFE
ncbi:MAG: hypothetical protein ABIS36_25465 [Chryseolinea sp.]